MERGRTKDEELTNLKTQLLKTETNFNILTAEQQSLVQLLANRNQKIELLNQEVINLRSQAAHYETRTESQTSKQEIHKL